MRIIQFLNLLFFFSVTNFCSTNYEQETGWHASGDGGAVATGSALSVQACLDILSRGGNAVDGAVAAIFNLGVSDYGLFCEGGEVPFMSYNIKTHKVHVFNGMGTAPKDPAAIDWFYTNGIPNELKGLKVSAVPSAISTCLSALGHDGTMSFEEVIVPTLKLLDEGRKSWSHNLAATFRKMIETEKNTSGNREQKIHAARDRFYKGDIADELDKFYVDSGGFLRKADLESYQTIIEEPVTIKYKGYVVNKCNTWTQGPVLLQALRLLENFDLKSMGYLSPEYIHVVTEAMKLAYADRDKYYGDPNFVTVPLKQLLSDQYTALRRPLIDMNNASDLIRPGDPYKMVAYDRPGQYRPGESGTTTCVVVDKWGNAVAATPSSNGDYSICKNLGFPHNTRLTSFNTQKGHPNSIRAGKRPRITLTPTIVLKKGEPVLAISVGGGDMQDQVSLQLLLDFIEFGMMPENAVIAPRFATYHVENSFNPSPDPEERVFKINGLEIDSTVDKSTIDDLKHRGHRINFAKGSIGWPVIIYYDQKTGVSYGAANPSFYSNVPTISNNCGALNISR